MEPQGQSIEKGLVGNPGGTGKPDLVLDTASARKNYAYEQNRVRSQVCPVQTSSLQARSQRVTGAGVSRTEQANAVPVIERRQPSTVQSEVEARLSPTR